MEEYKKRVSNERDDLEQKMARLNEFMHNETYAELPAVEQGLLMVQMVAMQNYSSVLFRRLELFD